MEDIHRLPLDVGDPAHWILRDAGAIEHLVHPLALSDSDVDRGGRVDDAGERRRYDEHRAAHAEDLDEGALVIQRALHVLVPKLLRSSPELHVDRRWIRCVDPGEPVGDGSEVRLRPRLREVVAGADAPPALGRIDPVHAA